jgi:hypothetical protein
MVVTRVVMSVSFVDVLMVALSAVGMVELMVVETESC